MLGVIFITFHSENALSHVCLTLSKYKSVALVIPALPARYRAAINSDITKDSTILTTQFEFQKKTPDISLPTLKLCPGQKKS